jgi:CubicO group peptidase (beta-lactamase class C family)
MTDSLSTIKNDLAAACKDPNKIPGAIFAAVDRSGKLLIHESAGLRQVGKDEPIDKNALFWMASCTKLITAIACMQLVEQGKLQLDEPISKVLPDISKLESNMKTKTTLRHLLTHTSGQSYPFFNNDTEKWFKSKGMPTFGCSKASLYAPLNSEPGEKWEYGSSIDWAGLAVEKVSGLSLDAYFKKYIFEPCGIKNMTLLPESGVPGGVKKTLAGMNFKDSSGKVTPMEHVIEQDESKIEVQYGGAGAYGNAAEVSLSLHKASMKMSNAQ